MCSSHVPFFQVCHGIQPRNGAVLDRRGDRRFALPRPPVLLYVVYRAAHYINKPDVKQIDWACTKYIQTEQQTLKTRTSSTNSRHRTKRLGCDPAHSRATVTPPVLPVAAPQQKGSHRFGGKRRRKRWSPLLAVSASAFQRTPACSR